jgi:hypothetical protein
MDRPEQVIEPARRRHPEQALHRLVGLVEEAVRNPHRELDHVAGGGEKVAAVDHAVDPPLEHVDELVLGRMDVRRHEGAGRKRRVPGERLLVDLLRHVGLAEDIPHDPVDARARPGYSSAHRLHWSFSSRLAAIRRAVAARSRGIEPRSQRGRNDPVRHRRLRLAARADHSDRHQSRLHNLGIKVKIAAIGGGLPKWCCRISDPANSALPEKSAICRVHALGEHG